MKILPQTHPTHLLEQPNRYRKESGLGDLTIHLMFYILESVRIMFVLEVKLLDSMMILAGGFNAHADIKHISPYISTPTIT